MRQIIKNQICCLQLPREPRRSSRLLKLSGRWPKILSNNILHWLINFMAMEPWVQCHIHKGFPIISILSWINPIPRTVTYFFKILSNIDLPSTPRPSWRPLSCWITCFSYNYLLYYLFFLFFFVSWHRLPRPGDRLQHLTRPVENVALTTKGLQERKHNYWMGRRRKYR